MSFQRPIRTTLERNNSSIPRIFDKLTDCPFRGSFATGVETRAHIIDSW